MSEETQAAGSEEQATEKPQKSAGNSKVALPVFYGKKAGMTRVFDKDGNHVPVTVVELCPNYISQVKTTEKDGYEAYQVTYCSKKEKLVNKPTKGHLAKAGVQDNTTRFAEVKAEGVDASNLGKEVDLAAFAPETVIDVTGTSKGKGFQGVIKRFGFAGGPAAHGSKFHRTTGSIGNRATPGRVWKNKKMPGHMGCEQKTVQNLEVFETNLDQGYMLIKGSVPGAKNSWIKVSKAVKARG